MVLDKGEGAEDPRNLKSKRYFCVSCGLWIDNRALQFCDANGHFYLPEALTPQTYTPPKPKPILQDVTLDTRHNDIMETVSLAKRRLHDAQFELAAQVEKRQTTYGGLHSTQEYWDNVNHENFLIIRCRELKTHLKAKEAELTYHYDTTFLTLVNGADADPQYDRAYQR